MASVSDFFMEFTKKILPGKEKKKEFNPKNSSTNRNYGIDSNLLVRYTENYTFTCILNFLALSMAETERYVVKYDEETNQYVRATDNRAIKINDFLRYQSNEYSNFSLAHALLQDFYGKGIAFQKVWYDDKNFVEEVEPLDDIDITGFISDRTNKLEGIRVGNEFLNKNDFFVFRKGLELKNLQKGIGIESYGAKILDLDNSMLETVYWLTKQLGFEVPVISPKGDVEFDDDSFATVENRYIEKTTGSNKGKPIVLTNAVDVHMLGAKLSDIDSRKLFYSTVAKVCAFFPIDPIIIGLGDENAAYNSKPDAKQNAYDTTIMPLNAVINRELSRQLLPRYYFNEWKKYAIETNYTNVLAVQKSIELLANSTSRLYISGVYDRAVAKGKSFIPWTKDDIDTYYTVKQVQILDNGNSDADLQAKNKGK